MKTRIIIFTLALLCSCAPAFAQAQAFSLLSSMPYVMAVHDVSGAHGGASVSGWQTRPLTAIVTDTAGIASLSSNAVTLPAGTYRFRARSMCVNGERNKVRLYNVTDSAVIQTGLSEFTSTADACLAECAGRFTITAAKAVRVEHYIQTAVASFGLGLAISDGSTERFGSLEIWKE